MNRLVFTAYQRPDYFFEVMEQWKKVRGFKEWCPTVHLEPSSVWEIMSAIADDAGADVLLNPRRYGVLHNPWEALDAAFSAGASFVVLAEDDVLASDDTLEYFTWAAQHFQSDHVLAVCAATFAATTRPQDEYRVERCQAFCPLVWGTWRDRWYDVLRDTWDHDYSSGTPEHPQSGWDWNINLRVMADWDIIRPLASRSTHIGRQMGTHTTLVSFPGSVAPTFERRRSSGAYYI